MKKFNKKISVIFPAYNEEMNIEPSVIIADALLREMVIDYEIIVVDDGSTDSTLSIARSLEKKHDKVRVIEHGTNKGYGIALWNGFNYAKFNLLFFTDSDRQFDILNIKDLLPYIDDYDFVIGYRKNRQDSLKRKILSWGFNRLVKIIFNIPNVRDIDCAFKLFNKHVFNEIQIQSKMYFVNTEILAKSVKQGISFVEVGVSHFPRVEGNSKVGFHDIPRTLGELYRIKKQMNSV